MILEWEGEGSNRFPVCPRNVDPGDSVGREFRIIRIVSAWSGRVVTFPSLSWWESAFYIWRLNSGLWVQSQELVCGMTWTLTTMYCLWLIWDFVVFLRGESWKFQAPAVTYVSILPIACPLKSIRPSQGLFFGVSFIPERYFLITGQSLCSSLQGTATPSWMFLDWPLSNAYEAVSSPFSPNSFLTVSSLSSAFLLTVLDYL